MSALTPLPPAPSIDDPDNFATEADAFVAALGTLVTELNLIIGATIPAGSAAASTLTGDTLAQNVKKLISGLCDARSNVAQHATTMNFWTDGIGGVIDGTGAGVTITAIANAPQAGASRKFYPLVGTILTHGATFDIDGNVNQTAAAGDCWEFVAKTVSTYKVHVTKEDGTAVVVASTSVGNHEVVVHTGNGHGSTNTKVRRFTTTLTNVGTAITYADSAANGASFTINEAGLYAIFYSDRRTDAGCYVGASVNSAELTTVIATIAVANRIMVTRASESTVDNDTGAVSRVIRLAVNDVVRPHTDGSLDDTTPRDTFAIIKVAA